MTRDLWSLIEEYIDARIELEKVPYQFRTDGFGGPIRQQKAVDNLRQRIIDHIEGRA